VVAWVTPRHLPRQGSSVDDACGSRAGSYLAVSLFLPGEKRLPGSQKSTIKSSLENVCRGGRHHPLFRRVFIQKLTTQLPGGGKGIHRSREWNPPPARREDHRSRSFCFKFLTTWRQARQAWEEGQSGEASSSPAGPLPD
jgi:hypothetical protein